MISRTARGQLRRTGPRGGPLRARLPGPGPRVGDAVVTPAQQCHGAGRLLRGDQTGLYIVPVNWHWSPRDRPHPHRQRGRGSWPTSGSPGLPGSGRPAGIGAFASARAGLRPPASWRTARTRGHPHTRRADAVHLRHLGRPKGVRRPLTGAGPGRDRGHGRRFFACSAREVRRNVHMCGSPLYHTAVLNFAGSRSSSVTRGADGPLGRRKTLQLTAHRVTHTHTVPPSSAVAGVARRRPRPL